MKQKLPSSVEFEHFFIFLIYFPQSPGAAGSINIYNLVEFIHSHYKPMTATEDWFLNSSNI